MLGGGMPAAPTANCVQHHTKQAIHGTLGLLSPASPGKAWGLPARLGLTQQPSHANSSSMARNALTGTPDGAWSARRGAGIAMGLPCWLSPAGGHAHPASLQGPCSTQPASLLLGSLRRRHPYLSLQAQRTTTTGSPSPEPSSSTSPQARAADTAPFEAQAGHAHTNGHSSQETSPSPAPTQPSIPAHSSSSSSSSQKLGASPSPSPGPAPSASSLDGGLKPGVIKPKLVVGGLRRTRHVPVQAHVLLPAMPAAPLQLSLLPCTRCHRQLQLLQPKQCARMPCHSPTCCALPLHFIHAQLCTIHTISGHHAACPFVRGVQPGAVQDGPSTHGQLRLLPRPVPKHR